jgi:hypothetical protein
MAVKQTSASQRNASLRNQSASVAIQAAIQANWLERKLKPKKVTARYPFKGTPLLYATCAFGSIGDALFGYNSGLLSFEFRNDK